MTFNRPAAHRFFAIAICLCVVGVPSVSYAQPSGETTVFSEKNRIGSVHVLRKPDGLSHGLVVDGALVSWSGDGSARRAHYPFIIAGSPGKALILGLGSGADAAAAVSHGVDRLDVVVKNPLVLDAATLFANDNRNALADPRVVAHIASAAEWMPSVEGGYGVIMQSDTMWRAPGGPRLLTLEHFENIRAALAPGGVAAQWIPLAMVTEDEMKTIAATFFRAFPYASAWSGDLSAVSPWILLLGSNEPQAVDYEKIRERLENVAGTGDMLEGGNAASFISFYIADKSRLEKLVRGAPVHTEAEPALGVRPASGPEDSPAALTAKMGFWSAARVPAVFSAHVPDDARRRLLSYFRARTSMVEGIRAGVPGGAGINADMYVEAAQFAPDDPHIARAFFNYGMGYYYGGLLDTAAYYFERSRDIAPDRAEARFFLGKTYEKMMRYPEAAEEFRKVKELNPGYFERVKKIR